MCYDGCMLDEIAGTASVCDFTLFECGYSARCLGQMASTVAAGRRCFFVLSFFLSCFCHDLLYFLDISTLKTPKKPSANTQFAVKHF